MCFQHTITPPGGPLGARLHSVHSAARGAPLRRQHAAGGALPGLNEELGSVVQPDPFQPEA